MQVVAAAAGLALVLFVFAEVFEALVLPRRVTRPLGFTRVYYRAAWRAWAAASRLLPPTRRRQTFLSLFGPFSLLALFAAWAAALIVGYGLVHYALAARGGSLADALYLSGATFSTLGYEDITPTTPPARALAVAEAATGFGFFAVVVGYLPVLYQAFSRREAFIALLDARAGSPPAAGRMLLRAAPGEGGGARLSEFLSAAERWAAEVLEGHSAFPVLGYYRSQHDNQSWLAALACTLDVSALLLTVVDVADRSRARLTFAMARHALVDLGMDLHMRAPAATVEDRLPDGRLSELLAVLRESGVGVQDDAGARNRLAELRGLYEPFVAGLAGYFRLEVPGVWPAGGGPDNWQTSAWMRRAGPLATLGTDPGDSHFD